MYGPSMAPASRPNAQFVKEAAVLSLILNPFGRNPNVLALSSVMAANSAFMKSARVRRDASVPAAVSGSMGCASAFFASTESAYKKSLNDGQYFRSN